MGGAMSYEENLLKEIDNLTNENKTERNK